jgi:hypothetical protein
MMGAQTMLSIRFRQVRALSLLAAASFMTLLSACQMSHVTQSCGDEECHEHAKICHNPTMHALACDLDCLEAHIDKYGSVVAMQPSVWGQARLTKYRDEFEKEMFKDYTKFAESLQGSVSRSDQAYFANAMAISGAISTPPAPKVPALAFKYPNPNLQISLNQASSPSSSSSAPSSPDASVQTDVFKGFDSISRSPVRQGQQLGFAGMASGGISLEPTIMLDQKQRYLDHLNQIRRNNEGDDTADSPGYSLNLVRIPVSVLPGKCTLKGCGAEITMTLTPVIGDELLPTTFRQLVINDLTEQLSLPLTKVMEKPDQVETMRKVLFKLDEYYKNIHELRQQIATKSSTVGQMKDRWPDWYRDHSEEVTKAFEDAWRDPRYKIENEAFTKQLFDGIQQLKEVKLIVKSTGKPPVAPNPSQVLQALRDYQMDALDSAYSSPSTQRASPFSIPLSQLFDVYDVHTLAHVVDEINDTVKSHVAAGKTPYHLEVAAVLRDELESAYRLLDTYPDLWVKHCNSQLVRAIRRRLQDPTDSTEGTIDSLLGKFFDDVNIRKPAFAHSGTEALAWTIIVEAALLNDRLQQDMRDAAAAQNAPRVNADHLQFFLPTPILPPEARQAFSEYVKTRWPIHVFALDPIAQDQNLADTYSRRQEMQLALSLAFASGKISARNMSRYARRIEEDMETIAINKTQIGFSHGSDTFGWRFYPRFQTPEFESNAKSLIRDQWIGGPSKNEEIRQMRLEPGMRECVAIVMMPSFVPYVKCEVSSNWFKLTNPKHKEFTLADAVRLGKTVKSVQTCSPNIKNANCYRDGDLTRLLAKAQQLEKRLPLQDMFVQVPYENTLGGFEMFNTGITDLAPQLRGWYGGPGVLDKQDTQLFLVGDHFSVHHTRVIAGGKEVTQANFELISRQVMKVTIPKGTTPNTRDPEPAPSDTATTPKAGATPTAKTPAADAAAAKKTTAKSFKYVDVHIATPYGVTSHLEIPYVEVAKPAASKTGLDWTHKSVEVGYVFAGNGIAQSAAPKSWPPLTIKWDTTLLGAPPTNAATADLALAFANPYSDEVAKVIAPPFPPQPIKVAGLDFTKLNPKTFELPIDATAFVNSVFGVAPLPAGFGGFFSRSNPPVPLVTTTVTLTLKDAKGNPLDAKGNITTGTTNPIVVGSGLTVTWSHTPGNTGTNVYCPQPCMPMFGPPVVIAAPSPPVAAPPPKQ